MNDASLHPGSARPGLRASVAAHVALLVGCAALALGIFVADCLLPRGVAVAALYAIPIVLIQRAQSPVWTVVAGLTCAILASIGISVSPDIGVPSEVVLADYGLVLLVITATTLLGILASRRARQIKAMRELLTICAWTKQVQVKGEWISIEEYLTDHLHKDITHGITEEYAEKLLTESGLELKDTEARPGGETLG